MFFGLFSSLSGDVLTTHNSPPMHVILSRTVHITFWTWVHTLLVDIQNQSQPGAAREDKVNKPWRPLPAGRLTLSQMQGLLSAMYLIIPSVGFCMDTSPQSAGMIVLGFIYNDLGGADKNFIVRNVVNAMGISCLCSGATSVALAGSQGSMTATANKWFLLVAAVIATTVQVQDMADQEGDRLRQRHTMPLIYGDGPARWSIAVSIAFWSFYCPFFFHLGLVGFTIPVMVGAIVISNTLTVRSIEGDKQTYRLYNLWMVTLFLLPLLKSLRNL